MSTDDLTRLLQEAANGDTNAAERLLPAVYDELRAMARRHLRSDPATIEPTALVHEAWIRVAGEQSSNWNHRAHFFGAASQAMRRVLVEHARNRHAKKRAAPDLRTTTADVAANSVDFAALLDIHAALSQLEATRPREAQIVLLRYFGGLEMTEIASLLEVSLGTAERDWRLARARLQQSLAARRPEAP